MRIKVKSRISRGAVLVAGVFAAAAIFPATADMVFAQDGKKLKIVSIDTGKILQVHPAFVEARKKFETELQGMQQQLENMNEEEQMKTQMQMQQMMQQRGEKLQQDALSELKKDVQKIADQKGYDYVLDSSSLIAGGENVTREVMQSLDLKEEAPADQKDQKKK